ncbi:P-loop containing nucleoside triphosphate hydrolase protein [Pelagophyceae sp. CCMP2097]|nr:P-loop containing nucleoside triphosphate hydrolase protein [Pelagophyceae sp. CCMP2097]
MEIYNEQGFDLLDPGHETKAQADMKRVKMMEDADGNFHLRNLGLHRAESEEDALNLLFLGDTNRAISATAMNQASSRSHCIFTIFIEGRQVGSDVVLRSKLHMVDLAGSERTHKTKSDGVTLREAQYINTSLFYLEMVIVALNEKSKQGRSHIPYRNSMMTSVLRDSLGGNCKTAMIATVSAEREQTDESISTCRFAQRVALVKNDAQINEETDPVVTISRLKGEVQTLRAEVQYLKGESGEGNALTDGERAELRGACEEYVSSRDAEAQLQVNPLTLTRIRDCFAIFKNMVLAAAESAVGGGGASDDAARLKQLLKERDNEIAILVNMVRQAKKGGGSQRIPPLALGAASRATPLAGHDDDDEASTSMSDHGPRSSRAAPRGAADAKQAPSESRDAKRAAPAPRRNEPKVIAGVSCGLSDRAIRDDPQQAFQYFRDRSKTNHAMEANKVLLKERFLAAKALGAQVNSSRNAISYLKKTIEQLRRERAVDDVVASPGSPVAAPPPPADEEKHRLAIEVEKDAYKASFDKLRGLKSEIEGIQKMLEAGRTRLQADFGAWYDQVLRTPPQPAADGDDARRAWATPPGFDASHAEPKAPGARARGAGDRGTPTTGNADADDDVRAFYKAKEELAQLQAKR